MEAWLVDNSLNDVKLGEEGEVLVRGPTVLRCYKGWMRTGDVLRINRDEFLYLTGRKKELIKYKGYAHQLYGGYAR